MTTNGVGGYSTLFPISLTGNEVSEAAFLNVAPTTLDFGGIVLSSNNTGSPVDSTLVFANQGLTPLTITGYGYTTDQLGNNPTFTNVTETGGVCTLGFDFTSTNLLLVGTVLQGGQSVSVDIQFNPTNGTDPYSSFFQTWSNG